MQRGNFFSTPVHQTRSEPVISTALNYTWACSWPGPAPAMRLIAQPWGYSLSGLLLAGLAARSPQTGFCLVFAKGERHRQRAKKLSRQLRTGIRCDMSLQGILGPWTSEDQCFLSTLLLPQLSVVIREKIFL